MTFEAEVIALVFLLDVLNRTAALDTAHGEPCPVGEGAHDARLPLQRGLDGFEERGRVFEVDDVDPAFCRADNEHFVAAHVHRVDAVFAFEGGDGLLLSQVPVLDHLVPRAGDQHGAAVVGRDRLNAADGLVMGGDLLGCSCAGAEVEHAGGFVCATTKDFLAVLCSISVRRLSSIYTHW